MPSDGYTGCTSGKYARKHNAWVNFTNVSSSANLRFSRFPTDFTTLPKVSIVVPNLTNDMHDGSITTGDNWARTNIGAYAQWAKTHNSLLIVTFDEDDSGHSNQIFTAFYGQSVKVGNYSERITHYSVLRTIENLYGLGCTGSACSATGITDVWQ
jgi:acid phosphatase